MDPRKLIRDPKRVLSTLKELPDGSLVTTKGCKIYIPTRFAERGLAQVGVEVRIVGIFAMVVEDTFYSTSLTNAMHHIDPSSSMKIMIDDDEYYEFSFDPGAKVLMSLDLVKNDVLTYSIYDEIISKARKPWYLSYLDLGRIFKSAKKHANANIGSNQEVTELLVSLISRDSDNRQLYYRQTVKSMHDVLVRPPAVIPMKSVQYAATNTFNKLAGSYFKDGVNSALVTPTDRVERIERLLRE